MRACSGTWIAHGSGSADRETVDRHDRVAVPPGQPLYQLRRIWLTPEEERGYYGGFANEGLWPLCHIAHVRPTFRTADLEYYRTVNARFADAVVAEAKTKDPVVLVQDYHFALLPRMIRDRLPDATIITFWHIPWPNPEAFAICPWRIELLDGLLGSSILGFHTQFHCNNFLDTVDRLLEARVDRESFTVACRGQTTTVHRYPISIEWPPAPLAAAKSVPDARRAVRERLGLPRDHRIGVGVDRLDYTKGILERLNAVARLLELEPRWIGRFTFVQIAAPSRGTLDDYRDYAGRVRALATAINARYSDAKYPPIALIAEHHEPDAVYEYMRAADVCVVTSLHDGMNLVAKEFVAARDDEQGVLILSQFAGASRELPEALVVNPYDADQCAAALQIALTMPADEQRERMRFMRGVVREFNVYRWAGRMLLDAAVLRQRGRFRQADGDRESWLSAPRRRRSDAPRRIRAGRRRAAARRPRSTSTARSSSTSTARCSSSRRRRTACTSTPASPRCCRRSRAGWAARSRSSPGARWPDADRLFKGSALPIAGQHGLERRGADGTVHRHLPSLTTLERLRGVLAQFAARHDGLFLEDKGATLALHYRLAPALASHVHRTLRAHMTVALAAESGWRLQPGKGILEIKPDGRDKGTAILEYMTERPFATRRPVFVGDDLTDEYGFAAVTAAGGWAVKVGDGRTSAHYRLPDVTAVRRWLAALVRHGAGNGRGTDAA